MANLRRFYFGTYANGALTGQNGWGTMTDGAVTNSYSVASGKLVLDMNHEISEYGNEIQNIFGAGDVNDYTPADYVLYFTYSKAGSGNSLLRMCGDADWVENGETLALELSSFSVAANQLKIRVVSDEVGSLPAATTVSENVRHMLWAKFRPGGADGVAGTFSVFIDGTQVYTVQRTLNAQGYWSLSFTQFASGGTGRPIYLVDEVHAANNVPLVMAQSTTGATVGSAIRVDCVGLPPGESFSVVLQQGAVLSPSFQSSELATGTADSNGYLSVSFASPPETPPGTTYARFTGDGETDAVSQSFTIAAAAVPPDAAVGAMGSAGGFGFGF